MRNNSYSGAGRSRRRRGGWVYEQLEFSGISDADAQNIIYRAAYNTSFSYECLEPSLQIYDKVYKNMGVGNGIFSWCSRARRQGGK